MLDAFILALNTATLCIRMMLIQDEPNLTPPSFLPATSGTYLQSKQRFRATSALSSRTACVSLKNHDPLSPSQPCSSWCLSCCVWPPPWVVFSSAWFRSWPMVLAWLSPLLEVKKGPFARTGSVWGKLRWSAGNWASVGAASSIR